MNYIKFPVGGLVEFMDDIKFRWPIRDLEGKTHQSC